MRLDAQVARVRLKEGLLLVCFDDGLLLVLRLTLLFSGHLLMRNV